MIIKSENSPPESVLSWIDNKFPPSERAINKSNGWDLVLTESCGYWMACYTKQCTDGEGEISGAGSALITQGDA